MTPGEWLSVRARAVDSSAERASSPTIALGDPPSSDEGLVSSALEVSSAGAISVAGSVTASSPPRTRTSSRSRRWTASSRADWSDSRTSRAAFVRRMRG